MDQPSEDHAIALGLLQLAAERLTALGETAVAGLVETAIAQLRPRADISPDYAPDLAALLAAIPLSKAPPPT